MKQQNLLLVTIVASLAGFLFGYDTGIINGTQFYFSKYFELEAVMKGWVVSSALVGCFAGALISGFFSKKYGRKNSLILSAILFTISAWGSGLPAMLPESVELLVFFRIIGGLGIGIASMNAPTYIAELSPAAIRGKMVTYYQLAIVVGFFVVFLSSYFIGGGNTQKMAPKVVAQLEMASPEVLEQLQIKPEVLEQLQKVPAEVFEQLKTASPEVLEQLQMTSEVFEQLQMEQGLYKYNLNQGWRLMFWSELIPCFIFLFLLFIVPKSPRWLILKGKNEEARAVLTKFYDTEEEVEKEYSQICQSMDKEEKIKISTLLKKPFLYIVLIGSALSALQQLTGINAVLYYGADIFEKALGFGESEVLKQQILLAGVNLVCTFIAMATVDKLGRKPLIYLGCLGMVLGFSMLGITLKTDQVGVISLIGILIFIGSFALSMGPVVWVLLSEIFPNKIRSLAMSIAVAAQWGMNFIVSQSFPVLVESEINKGTYWNESLPYFIFIGFILITFFLTWKFIPETRGKSLEELEKTWS